MADHVCALCGAVYTELDKRPNAGFICRACAVDLKEKGDQVTRQMLDELSDNKGDDEDE